MYYARYPLLILMPTADVVCTVPLALFVLISNGTRPIHPWKGFADFHSEFSRVGQYPVPVWIGYEGNREAFEVNDWLAIGSAFLYFLLFGLMEGARRQYISVLNFIALRIGLPVVPTIDMKAR